MSRDYYHHKVDIQIEKGKVYDCSWFGPGMGGCSARFRAVMRKGELVLQEVGCSVIRKPDYFYYICLSDNQEPHLSYSERLSQYED